MKITCISDLHGHYPELPRGDLLIVAVDLTARDNPQDLTDFYQWIDKQRFFKKIVIAGNHDNYFSACHFQISPAIIPFRLRNTEYLCDSGTEFEGLKIWGSPWTKTFKGMNPNCKAFTKDTEEELADKWITIPRNIDILVTHSPPFNWLDKTIESKYAGSDSLLEHIAKWKPRLHVFGHIHEAYGQEKSFFGRRNFGNKYGVIMVNASHVNERYESVNKPIEVIL